MATEATPAPRRLHRLERPALTGVLVREVVNYSSYWRSSTFSSTVEEKVADRQYDEKLTTSRTSTPVSAERSSLPSFRWRTGAATVIS